MKKEKYVLKKIILFLTFVPSLTLFWDIVSAICGYKQVYTVYQFSCAAYFVLFSIFMTKDIEHFNSFWEKHVKWRIVFEKLLHFSAVIIACLPIAFMMIPLLFSKDNLEEDVKVWKQVAGEQIKEYDDAPLIVRTVLLVGVLTLIMIFLTNSNILTGSTVSWIQEILNTLVSLVGLLFVIVNAKE